MSIILVASGIIFAEIIVRYEIELNAGLCKRFGIAIGDDGCVEMIKFESPTIDSNYSIACVDEPIIREQKKLCQLANDRDGYVKIQNISGRVSDKVTFLAILFVLIAFAFSMTIIYIDRKMRSRDAQLV